MGAACGARIMVYMVCMYVCMYVRACVRLPAVRVYVSVCVNAGRSPGDVRPYISWAFCGAKHMIATRIKRASLIGPCAITYNRSNG